MAMTFLACNVNPNKEERIQTLENQIKVANERMHDMEEKIAVLEKELNALDEKLVELKNTDQ